MVAIPHAALVAKLKYVTDSEPGIRRVRRAKGFSYVAPGGEPLRDRRQLERVASLVIPPAWEDVWICANPRGHIQATGRDEKGRKQYVYHPRWRESRDQGKYERLVAFGKCLARLRRRVNRDMARPGLSKTKVVATCVKLLQATCIRVGNDEYARTNRSYGLTTLRDRHAKIDGDTIHFEFKGKHGVEHSIDLRDRRLAKIVRDCQDLPGQDLFQYVGAEGRRRKVRSDDVNAYLREATGRDFTAKDFRTWSGTVLAAAALKEFETFDTEAAAKRNVVRAIEQVAKRLGNTKTVCRQCYIHPAVIDAYLDGTFRSAMRWEVEKELKESIGKLSGGEAAVLAFLQRRLRDCCAEKPRRGGSQ